MSQLCHKCDILTQYVTFCLTKIWTLCELINVMMGMLNIEAEKFSNPMKNTTFSDVIECTPPGSPLYTQSRCTVNYQPNEIFTSQKRVFRKKISLNEIFTSQKRSFRKKISLGYNGLAVRNWVHTPGSPLYTQCSGVQLITNQAKFSPLRREVFRKKISLGCNGLAVRNWVHTPWISSVYTV